MKALSDEMDEYQERLQMIDDIVEEPFTAPDYWTNAPTAPGLGFVVDRNKLKKYTVGTMVL